MSLQSKLNDPQQFVLLYGTTPPRLGSTPAEIETAASKLVERIQSLPLDGIVVYDVQDESGRTAIPRPFPFLPTLDSRTYSRLLHEQTGKSIVTYKCVSAMTADSWDSWLSEATNAYGIRCLSLVGAPSTRNSPVSLSLPQSLRLAAAHPGHFTLGGVCIAERHSEERSESKRMLQKAEDGCSFFISQAVYHPGSTIRMLRDYQADCQRLGVQPRRVILTFTPCGRPKTLEFIKWLGVHISPETEDAILSADDPLRKSIQICCDTLRQIVQQDYNTTIPLGLNIESVSINKQEIDGSIELFHALTEVLEHHSRRL